MKLVNKRYSIRLISLLYFFTLSSNYAKCFEYECATVDNIEYITYTINNQEDFDELTNVQKTRNGLNFGDRMWSLLSNCNYDNRTGIKIVIQFKNGTYYFDNSTTWKIINLDHSTLKHNSKTEIIFKAVDGEIVNIMSKGNVYEKSKDRERETTNHYVCKLKDGYHRGETYVDQDFNRIPLLDSGELDKIKINSLDTSIIVEDSINHILKMKPNSHIMDAIGRNKNSNYFKNSLVYWKMSWMSGYGSIYKTTNDYIYLHYDSNLSASEYNRTLADDLSENGYNYQFYITNISNDMMNKNKIYIKDDFIYIPQKIDKVYECEFSNFLSYGTSKLKSLTIKNLNFVGSAMFDAISSSSEKEYIYDTKSLIHIYDEDNITISDNLFKNIGSRVVINGGMGESSNIFNVLYNKAENLYGKLFQGNGDNIIIQNNHIERAAIFFQEGGIINVGGKGFCVSDNIIVNFPYSGIASQAYTDKSSVTGIIERNELYNKDEYISDYERYTLRDGGLIYFWFQSNNTGISDIICQHNIVHDFKGRSMMRGIFLDNGVSGVTVEGNLIYNIEYKHLYDSYQWNEFNSFGNISNALRHNIILGAYRFQGNPENTVGNLCCIKDQNYLGGVFNNLDVEISNTCVNQSDIIDPIARMDENQIILYEDISNFNLPSFITDRIVQCEVLKLNKTPQFTVSNNFMRLSTLNLNGYENSLYDIQNNNISSNGTVVKGWITSYKQENDIEISLNDEFQLIEGRFSIIGTPVSKNDLTDEYYPVSLKINNGDIPVFRNVQAINPIFSGINNKIYIEDGDFFRTDYIPMNQLKGIVFETLATNSIKLGVKIKCMSKSTRNIVMIKKDFPIYSSFIKPTQKYLTLGKEQANFSLSSYWTDPEDLYLTNQSNSIYIGRKIILGNGFIGKNGFVAKASYTINEIGDTQISFIEKCRGRHIDINNLESMYYMKNTAFCIANDDEEDSAINIYPNPSDGIFYIQGLDVNMECNIDIYDISGRNVYSGKGLNNGDQIDIRDKSRSVYIVRISIKGHIITRKLILT